ncbi:MFS general substrate transporter, partial [Saccharata proteae CBS 121410]
TQAAANFSDGYQQKIASNDNVIFKHLLSSYSTAQQTRVSNSLIVGQILGILLLGVVSDGWSRKAGIVFTSTMVVLGSLMATVALSVRSYGINNMIWYLTIARGVAGVGVGGEFPPSASAVSEGMDDHNARNRGPVFVFATTFVTCWGGPICILVYLLTLIASNDNLQKSYIAVNAISIFLPIFVFFFRIRMRDSRLFKTSNFKSTSTTSIPLGLILKRYWLRLLGTGGAFFLYDFINFPNSIMSSVIINSLVPGKNLRTVAIWQFILALMTLPGVLAGMYLVNRIGRRWTGIAGFAGYLLVGLIVGASYAQLSAVIPAFVVLYGLMQSLGHMGPGSTLGLVSTESYPTAVRGTCYAISAALGKTGAAVGTEAFTPIKEHLGQRWTFFIAAIVGAVGMAVYWFLIEDMTDAKLAEQDVEFERYLRECGWGGSLGKVVEEEVEG